MTGGNCAPPGWPRIAPRLFTHDVAGLVEFMHAAFGATGEMRTERANETRIGDSVIIVSDGGGLREQSAAFLYVYVPDADAAYRIATDAGAETIEAPTDMPYGDRRATVRDRWGNTWQIATYRGI